MFAKSLKEQLPAAATGELRFTDEEVLCAQIAGLCHDLGSYMPYSIYSDKKLIVHATCIYACMSCIDSIYLH